jgi:hypothetical protein
MKKPISLFWFCFVFSAGVLMAQPYQSAIGARIGFGSGITYKTFLNPSSAVELIAAYQLDSKGYSFTGMYEFHNYRILRTSSLAIIFGVGAHLGHYTGGYYKNRRGIIYADKVTTFGLDGMLGLDFCEPGSRLNWTIDVKPVFDFVNPGFRFWDGAISVRYAF